MLHLRGTPDTLLASFSSSGWTYGRELDSHCLSDNTCAHFAHFGIVSIVSRHDIANQKRLRSGGNDMKTNEILYEPSFSDLVPWVLIQNTLSMSKLRICTRVKGMDIAILFASVS
jgi:hypothetical protein